MSDTANVPASDWFTWQELPSFPASAGLASGFMGTSRGIILVAGGMSYKDATAEGSILYYANSVYALSRQLGEYRWDKVGHLEFPVAQGGSATWYDGIACVGGANENGCSSATFMMRWLPDEQRVQIQPMPPLPRGLRFPAAAILDNILYVAGGQDDRGEFTQHFWALDLKHADEWLALNSWNGEPRSGTALIAQSNGEKRCLFLIGGKAAGGLLDDVHCYDVVTGQWQKLDRLPYPVYLAPAAALGPSHIVLFGGMTARRASDARRANITAAIPDDTLLYNSITRRWSATTSPLHGIAATTAVESDEGLVIVGGVTKGGETTPTAYRVSILASARQLTILDFGVMAAYLLLIVSIGMGLAGRGKTSDDYFIAGRRVPWWAAGISIMATQISPIGFMAVPAKSFATNWLFAAGVVTWLVTVPIVVKCFIPFFRQLRARTAYQYLELRFGRPVCVYAAIVYSLSQLTRLGIIIYLPALALASTTNFNLMSCIVAMGTIATIYTVAGGMGAVVWTDVIQATLLIGGALLVLVWVAFQANGGPIAAVQTAYEADKLRIAQLRWEISDSSLWVVLVGIAFARLAELTSDQAVVQRYQSTPTQEDAARALWLNAALSVPWAILVFSLGTALYVFYHDYPQLLSPTIASDGILAFFVAQQLPTGVCGLIIAALFFEATSSLVTAMHSTATVWSNDLYARWFPNTSDRALLRLARGLVVVLGFTTIATAVWMSVAQIISMWDFFLGVTGPLIGSVCGLFLLGIFTTRTNSAGALIGAFGSCAVTWYVANFTPVYFLLYAPASILSCTLIGYAGSWLFPRPMHIAGLTFRTSENPNEVDAATASA